MTITTYLTIDCDADGCTNSFHRPFIRTVAELRRQGRAAGWKHTYRAGNPRRYDLCPECVAKPDVYVFEDRP